MLPLLAIILVALLVGKFAARITPAVELLLLLLIAVIAVAELLSWGPGGAGPSPGDVIWGLMPDR